jgi:hypothetical protein
MRGMQRECSPWIVTEVKERERKREGEENNENNEVNTNESTGNRAVPEFAVLVATSSVAALLLTEPLLLIWSWAWETTMSILFVVH